MRCRCEEGRVFTPCAMVLGRRMILRKAVKKA
jgi:hypothetical protein